MRSGGGPSRSPGARATGARRTLPMAPHRPSRGGGGAGPSARVGGYGRTTDAYHVTAPDIEGRGVERAMRLALEDADLSAGAVGHVTDHAPSPPTGARARR